MAQSSSRRDRGSEKREEKVVEVAFRHLGDSAEPQRASATTTGGVDNVVRMSGVLDLTQRTQPLRFCMKRENGSPKMATPLARWPAGRSVRKCKKDRTPVEQAKPPGSLRHSTPQTDNKGPRRCLSPATDQHTAAGNQPAHRQTQARRCSSAPTSLARHPQAPPVV